MITVELNKNAENRLREGAEAKGLPVEIYARQLLEGALDEPAAGRDDTGVPAHEALADYIGAIDSSTVTPDVRYRSAYGDILEEKYAKRQAVK